MEIEQEVLTPEHHILKARREKVSDHLELHHKPPDQLADPQSDG